MRMKTFNVSRHFILIGALLSITSVSGACAARQTKGESNMLSQRQQGIAAIAAHTASGNLDNLRVSLNEGLDAGLTISEIKEILVQMYAYSGFPRSLNGLNTFMAVLDERRQRGIQDVLGREAAPLPADKSRLQLGTEIQTRLIGAPAQGPTFEFAPSIDAFLKAHLFGDIFGRDNLDFQSREIATIAALASLGRVESQLRSHLNIGLNVGLTAGELKGIVELVRARVGAEEGAAAAEVLAAFLDAREKSPKQAMRAPAPAAAIASEAQQRDPSAAGVAFALGEEARANFTGKAYVSMLIPATDLYDTSVYNVTFEPGTRNHWHKHAGGQLLLCTLGIGYYQERGKSIQVLHPGDVVEIAPEVEHWHGASPRSRFAHIGITPNASANIVTWLLPVSDAEYGQTTGVSP